MSLTSDVYLAGVTDAVIPEQYLAKRGDRPRSLPPEVTAETSDATVSGRFLSEPAQHLASLFQVG